VLSNAVYLLPAADAVARAALTPDALPRVRRAVQVTRWLASLGFPCVQPLEVDQPAVVADPHGEVVVSLWRYVPRPPGVAPPSAEAFGRLLRRLHALPAPPVSLPPMRPMARLDAAVEAGGTLGDADRAWLLERRRTLLSAFQLDSPLGHGLVHGDAHLGNLLPSAGPAGMVLADWDSVVDGPREWDLVLIAANDRFGRSAADRAAFARGYGYDVTTWPGWTVLRDLRELHSLAAYLRLAPTDPPAAAELQHRLESLRSGDRSVVWHALG
jgi:aminoglycoside phosphotransferase (APT) family kinase protein